MPGPEPPARVLSSESARYEQQPGETARAYHAFKHYLDLGSVRSIERAFLAHCDSCEPDRLRKVPGHWREYSGKYNWRLRARSWDEHLAQVERAQAEQVAAEDGAARAVRREDVRRTERDVGKLAMAAAREMLTYAGIVETTTSEERHKEGRTPVLVRTIHHVPKWTIRDAVALARLADLLLRLADEMPTNLSGVVDDAEAELRALAESEGLDPEKVIQEARRLSRVHNL